jgi:hypothetical protein
MHMFLAYFLNDMGDSKFEKFSEWKAKKPPILRLSDPPYVIEECLSSQCVSALW